MKKSEIPSTKHLFKLAFILILIVNLLILYRVYDNRTSKADSMVILTQNELSLPYRSNYGTKYSENSKKRFLKINWKVYNPKQKYYYRKPLWLNEKKLKELGFNINKLNYKKEHITHIPREAFVVLEVNSPFKNKSIKNIQKLVDEKNSSSLYVIDAGIDRYRLREKYSNRNKYIILHAIINISTSYKKNTKIQGRIQSITVPNIHIEEKWHKKVGKGGKYNAKIAFGSRLDPYIISIEKGL